MSAQPARAGLCRRIAAVLEQSMQHGHRALNSRNNRYHVCKEFCLYRNALSMHVCHACATHPQPRKLWHKH
eukprot:4987810-Pleurochrysis_carterae.AAC.1